MSARTGAAGLRETTLALILAVFWASALAQGVLPDSIEVFLSAQAPIATDVPGLGVPVTVYDLDAPKREEARFGQGLPADRDAAKQEAKRRLANISEAQHERIKSSFAGLLKVLQYGLDRYPAIVFDEGQAVVYGHDLQEALGYYRAWRQREGQRR